MSNGEQWTEGEVEQLRRLRGSGLKISTIAMRLGRSQQAVRWRCAHEGIRAKTYRNSWTEDEEAALVRGKRDGDTIDAIALRLGRTYGATQKHWNMMRDAKHPPRKWTVQDDNKLRTYVAQEMPDRQIGAKLNRSTHAIRRRMRELDIAPPSKNRPWTKREEAIVAAGIEAGKTPDQIGELIDRSAYAVRDRYLWLQRRREHGREGVKAATLQEFAEACGRREVSAPMVQIAWDEAQKRHDRPPKNEEDIAMHWSMLELANLFVGGGSQEQVRLHELQKMGVFTANDLLYVEADELAQCYGVGARTFAVLALYLAHFGYEIGERAGTADPPFCYDPPPLEWCLRVAAWSLETW